MKEVHNHYLNQLEKIDKQMEQFFQEHPAASKNPSIVKDDPEVKLLVKVFSYLTANLEIYQKNGFKNYTKEINLILFRGSLLFKPATCIAQISKAIDSNGRDELKVTDSIATQVEINNNKTVNLKFTPAWDKTYFNGQIDYSKTELKEINEFSTSSLKIYINAQQESVQPDTKIEFSCSGANSNFALNLFYLIHHKLVSIKVYKEDEIREQNDQQIRFDEMHKANQIQVERSKKLTLIDNISKQEVIFECLKNDRKLYNFFNTNDYIRLLMEYIALPEKFAFFSVPVKANHINQGQLIYEFIFDENNIGGNNLDKNDININAVPIVNLFPIKSKPTIVKYQNSGITINPINLKNRYLVHQIENVEILDDNTQNSWVINFNDHLEDASEGRSDITYNIEYQKDSSDNDILKLNFITNDYSKILNKTMNAKLICSNGARASGIKKNKIIGETKTGFNIKNITLSSSFYKSQVSNQKIVFDINTQLNFLTKDIQGKEGLIQLLNFVLKIMNCKDQKAINKFNSINNVNYKTIHKVYRGEFISGINIQITCVNDIFSSIGDLNIFGLALVYLFARYIEFNQFLVLEIGTDKFYIKYPHFINDDFIY